MPAEAIHGLVGLLLAGLFVLHVAGALRHHLLRDDVIGRMMPAALGRRPWLSAGVVLALAGCAAAFVAGNAGFRRAGATAPGQPAPAAASAAVAPAPAAPSAAVPLPVVSPSPGASPTPSASPSPSPSPAATNGAAMPLRDWRVQSGGTLGFRADYSGDAIEGRFARWTARIRFSPEDLAGSRIDVDIDLASVASGDSERDDTLRGEDFFAVAAHPRAHFAATRIRRQGRGYVADGTLALAGASQAVPVRFDLVIDGDRARASGSATVRRLAFGVGKGQWSDPATIADAVAVTFRFDALAR
jgi:polyisoprenoid-binding protein YceI